MISEGIDILGRIRLNPTLTQQIPTGESYPTSDQLDVIYTHNFQSKPKCTWRAISSFLPAASFPIFHIFPFSQSVPEGSNTFSQSYNAGRVLHPLKCHLRLRTLSPSHIIQSSLNTPLADQASNCPWCARPGHSFFSHSLDAPVKFTFFFSHSVVMGMSTENKSLIGIHWQSESHSHKR